MTGLPRPPSKLSSSSSSAEASCPKNNSTSVEHVPAIVCLPSRLLFTVIEGCRWGMIIPHAFMIRDQAGFPCKMSAPRWQRQSIKGKHSAGKRALLRNRAGGMWCRLPALLLLLTALHMPPAASTHPREPEIRRLAEPAAGEPATRASHQAQASTAAGDEGDLESGVGTRERANRGFCLPTPSKEGSKCSLGFTLSSNIHRNSQSAFCLAAIGCKMSSRLAPCGTSLVGCRFQPSWVPRRQFLSSPLRWQHSALFFQVLFLWQNYCKGAVCLTRVRAPCCQGRCSKPSLAKFTCSTIMNTASKKELKFVPCTSALSQSMAVLSLAKCLETSFTIFSNLPSPVTLHRSNVMSSCPKLRVYSPVY